VRIDSEVRDAPAEGGSGAEPLQSARQAAAPLPVAMERVGTGRLVNERGRARVSTVGTAGEIDLDFEDTDIRNVVAVILGDLLAETYYLHPAVKGTVTVRNSRPLTRGGLIPVLELLLQMNDAALVRADDGYKVIPLEQAPREALPAVTAGGPLSAGPGFTVQVIPLRYAAAEEVKKILEPYVPERSSLRAIPERNVLILAAPGSQVADFLETVEVFDADWLEGMSMGMFPLTYADAEQVAAELEGIIGEESGSPLAGMVRLFPVQRLNALLVVTPQRSYLAEMKDWIKRLDQGGGTPQRRLYVYEVRNTRADHIGQVLSDVFGDVDEAAPAPVPPALLAPGLEPATVASRPVAEAFPAATAAQQAQQEQQADDREPVAAAARAVSKSAPLPAVAPASPVRFIADTVNNSLLVLATPEEWEVIEAAIRRLDVLPRQVLVEATIAEVRLNDNLSYGVQWFIKGGIGKYSVEFRSLTGDSGGLPRAAAPGFSGAVFPSLPDVRIFIEALEAASEVRVLSSPQLLVTDNQTANIRVGTQVPVTTRRSTGGDTGGVVIQEIEYRDTGVLLTVTPRINAGGMVTMEVSQEVSQVGPEVGATGNVSVDQRSIDSFISVKSGETIVLGGLITERKTDSTTGIPFLSRLPIVGPLFGKVSDAADRNELIVLITPNVVNNPDEAREITSELRRRLKGASNLKHL
jgi:general secretion pathway protein D